jgi:hypothetical protein
MIDQKLKYFHMDSDPRQKMYQDVIKMELWQTLSVILRRGS